VAEEVKTRLWQAGNGLPQIAVRRLAQAVPSLFLVTFAAYALMRAAPGDPLTARMDRDALVRMTPEQREAARDALGLNDSLVTQYLTWLKGVFHGDFGYSISTGRPALTEVTDRLGPTLLLMGGALVVAVSVGLGLGIAAARHRGTAIDRILSGTVVGFIATPPFVVGLLAVFVLSIQWGWFPAGGLGIAGEPLTVAMAIDHLILPALVLGLANAAPLGRYSRAAMIEVLDSDYVRTARSIGESDGQIVRRHGLRNAALPMITIVAVLVADLMAAAVVTEEVFAWPGLGRLVVKSAQSADAPVLMVVVILVAVTTMTMNLLADLLYVLVDPRVRLT